MPSPEGARNDPERRRSSRGRPIDLLTLTGIAPGMARDAFAVAIATGIAPGTISGRQDLPPLPALRVFPVPDAGRRIGKTTGRRLEVAGGVILEGIGVRILVVRLSGEATARDPP